jgi:hypothetical protein
MEHTNDLVLAAVRYAPLMFIIGGLVFLAWLSKQLTASELRPDVLAALSETEALPLSTIRDRPPLDARDLDLTMLARILDELCGAGLVVRWYEDALADNGRRVPVYRKLKPVAETAR